MSASTLLPSPPWTRPTPVVPSEPVFPLSVEQYHEMMRAGVLLDGDPVELIEGVLVMKMTKYPPHASANSKATAVFIRLLPPGYHYRIQDPITLGDGEPEPDGLVARGTSADYNARHPGPADALLVLEITDTTLRRDRGTKLRSYARAGLPVYWLLNLNTRRLEVYTRPDPAAAAYLDRRDHAEADAADLVLDGGAVVSVRVSDLLP